MQGLKKLFLPISATLGFIQNHFKAMLFLLLLFVLFAPSAEEDLRSNNLEHIVLQGAIMDATEVVEQIEQARKNDSVKAVLFEINSPGGAVAPSIEISYAIKRLQEAKPVLVYASGMLASGGYYSAIFAQEIMANPGSMVGSIGVIMHGANVGELMQKIGIKSQTVQAGKYKQVGTADREWTAYEKAELEKVIQSTYTLFVEDVAKGRKLDIKDKDTFANAHIFTASQAKEVGLIDELGVAYDAKARLVTLSGVKEPIWNKEDKFDAFLKKISAQTASQVQLYFPSLSLR